MRYFTKEDWYGLAGAEAETEGLKREPAINERENILNAQIVVDKNGIQVIGEIDGEESYDQYAYDFGCTYDAGLILAKYLEENLGKSFEELDKQMANLGLNRIL
jgi:hypothetical protein